MTHIDSVSIEHHPQRGNVFHFWKAEVAGRMHWAVNELHWCKYTRPRKLGCSIDTCRTFAKAEKRVCWRLTDMVQEIKEWSTSAM